MGKFLFSFDDFHRHQVAQRRRILGATVAVVALCRGPFPVDGTLDEEVIARISSFVQTVGRRAQHKKALVCWLVRIRLIRRHVRIRCARSHIVWLNRGESKQHSTLRFYLQPINYWAALKLAGLGCRVEPNSRNTLTNLRSTNSRILDAIFIGSYFLFCLFIALSSLLSSGVSISIAVEKQRSRRRRVRKGREW